MNEALDFEALSKSPLVNLIVRCGGNNGKCGKKRALVLDGGRVVERTPEPCAHVVEIHEVTEQGTFELRRNIDSRAERARAERMKRGTRFRAQVMIVRPRLRNLREDKDQRQAEDWAMFRASGELLTEPDEPG